MLSNGFALIYFVEFMIKFVGLGPRQYFRDKWNMFDFFLVLVQVGTSAGTAITYFLGGDYGTLNLSYIRSLRVLRLARYSRSVRQLLLTLLFGMPDLINILGVVYVVMYVFSIAGMTIFSGMILKPFPQGGPGYDHHANFNNIYLSMQTVFQLLTGDSWSGFYLDAREVR